MESAPTPQPSADAQHYPKHFPNMLQSYLPSHHDAFRRVLWTGLHSQLTTITVPEGGNMVEDIQSADQTITITTGSALAQVGSRNSPRQQALRAGDMLTVPAGAPCELVNTGPMPLGVLLVTSW